jgi:hypothetical protein
MINAVIIGPSSSGKTSIASALASKVNGIRISLDGDNEGGRLKNTIKQPITKFSTRSLGTQYRLQMINDVKNANKKKKNWFIDDISPHIVQILIDNKIKNFKVVILLPTVGKITSNINTRNREAKTTMTERSISNSINHLTFLIRLNPKGEYSFSIQELIDAYTHEKYMYSQSDAYLWRRDIVNMIKSFGIPYDCLYPPLKTIKYKFSIVNIVPKKSKIKVHQLIISEKTNLKTALKKVISYLKK